MEEKILITCDSALDLSPDLRKEYHIKVLPVVIKMDGGEYLDIEEISAEDILSYHDRTGELAVTAPPGVQQTFRFFTRFVHMGYTVIHFSLSSALSPAYANAVTAAENFERVTVIDSRTASVAGGLLLLTAAEMVREGKSAKEIIQHAKDMITRLHEPFILDNIEFLYKGGRASAMSKFVADLFNVKLSLYVNHTDGTLQAGKKYRGKFENSTSKFIRDNIGNPEEIDKTHFMIGHTGLENGFLQDCKTELEQFAGLKQIHIVRAGSTITSHLGRNALIFAWYTKKN